MYIPQRNTKAIRKWNNNAIHTLNVAGVSRQWHSFKRDRYIAQGKIGLPRTFIPLWHFCTSPFHTSLGEAKGRIIASETWFAFGPDKGLSPIRRQVIIWTNTGILFIEHLGTVFSENMIDLQTFLLKKMHSKMSSGKLRPFVSASMC